jgi:hypothetical protein
LLDPISELFGGNDQVAWSAQVLGVLIFIASAVRQWNDVVDHCRDRGAALSFALPST